MSTTYYLPPEPITQLSMRERDGQRRLYISFAGKLAGSLAENQDETNIARFLWLLLAEGTEACSVSWTKREGPVATWFVNRVMMKPTATLIDENGELTTIDDLQHWLHQERQEVARKRKVEDGKLVQDLIRDAGGASCDKTS